MARENQPSVVVDAPRDRAGGAVEGLNPSAPELAPPIESPPPVVTDVGTPVKDLGERAAEYLDALTPSNRTKRWREKNREKYNSYMREYRARKK